VIKYQGSGAAVDKKTYLLVSSRPWTQNIAADLCQRIGADFVLISDPTELTRENLIALSPNFVFLPHWSYRINADLYEQFECVIFHMTDVPFGRGGSPLQNLIARGIYETQISAIQCIREMDAGPVYLKRVLSLHGSAEEIFIRAADVIKEMIIEIIEKLPEPIPQQGVPITFKRRRPEDGNLLAVESLVQAFDMIRMLDAKGYPNAYLNMGAFKIEFSRASLKVGVVIADVRITLREESNEENTE
jgi:methionyl-tRNA formyltransferase